MPLRCTEDLVTAQLPTHMIGHPPGDRPGDLARPHLPSREAGAVAAVLVGGLLAGWGVAADLVGRAENPLVQMALLVGQVPAPWAAGGLAVGFVAARAGARPASAAAWAVLALLLADVLYYTGQLAAGARSSQDAVLSAATTWGMVAVGAGVVLGTAGAVLARPDRHGVVAGGVALGLLGAIFLAEAAVLAGSALGGGVLDLGRLDLGRLGYAALDVAVVLGLAALVQPRARAAYGATVLVVGCVGGLLAGTAADVIGRLIG